MYSLRFPPELIATILLLSVAVGGATAVEDVSKCAALNVDLIFVLDGSESIGSNDFVLAVEFVGETVRSMRIGANQSQIGLVQFSDAPRTEFELNTFLNRSELLEKIGETRQLMGGTAIGKAMGKAITDGFSEANGNRQEYPDVMIVITDGKDRGTPKHWADVAQTRGILTFAIGIGPSPSQEQLLEIANGHRSRVSRFRDFRELAASVERVCKPIVEVVEPALPPIFAPPTYFPPPMAEGTTTTVPPTSSPSAKPPQPAPTILDQEEEEQCCTVLMTNYHGYPKFRPCAPSDPNSCTTNEVCLPICIPV